MEEVKLVLKPAYNTRKINKEAYKEILRKTVPKVLVKSSFDEKKQQLELFITHLISGLSQ